MKDDNILDIAAVKQFKELVEKARKIVLTCHVSPDGDAMGSTLGLARVLELMGKHPIVITPDRPPKSLSFLPGYDNVVAASFKPTVASNMLRSADLVLCLDYNASKRVDKMEEYLLQSPATKVMIDHHLDPEGFCDVTISMHHISSTCALLYLVIEAAGWLDYLDKDAASCIYTGMMTDTGNFSYNSNDPTLYTIVADLVRRGVDKDALYNKACNTFSESCLRLNGYALAEKMQIFREHQAALITLSLDELKRFGYIKGDTEGLVNKPLSIPGITYSCFLREDEPGFVKVSMRSKGSFPVNRICEEYFNGGGHKNAAGGELYMTLDEAIELYMHTITSNDKYL